MSDTFDIPEENEVGSFDVVSEPNPQVPRSMSEQLSSYYAARLTGDHEQIKADIDAGLYPMLESEADQKANQNNTQRSQQLVNRVLETRPDEEEATRILEQAQEGFVYENHSSPDVAVSLSETSEFTRIERRAVERSHAAQRLTMMRAEEINPGVLPAVGYFMDSLVSDIVSNIVGSVDPTDTLTTSSDLKAMAEEAVQLLYMDISKEEFETRYSEILDRAADRGLFSQTNPLALNQFILMVQEAGLGRETEGAVMTQFFEVADVAALGAGKLVRSVAKSGARLGDAPKSISKTTGNEQANEVIVNSVESGTDGAVAAENTAASMINPAQSDSEFFSAPELQARRELEANSAAMKIIRENNPGEYVSGEKIEELKDTWVAELKERHKGFSKHALDYKVREDSRGNLFGFTVLGKRSGEPYKSLSAAQKYADQVGGEVVETSHKGQTNYVVHKEWAIPTEGLADATNPKEVAHGFLHSIMSTTARTTSDLDARLKQGEAFVAKTMKDLEKPYRKARGKVSEEERTAVGSIFESYLNDPNFNDLNAAPTTEQFADLWAARNNARPSKEVLDYYEAIRDINDLDYHLQSDILFKEAVNNKEEMVKLDGAYYRSKVVQVEPGTKVYNPDTGRFIEATEDTTMRVHEIHNFAYEPEGVGKVRYVVTDGETTRRLYHSDVMGYNFGGHRKYTDKLGFFLKQKRDITLADGTKVDGKPITFMGVRVEDEARMVTAQFNNILKGARDGLDAPAMNTLIRANNDWNPDIEDVADMDDFLRQQGMTWDDDIDWAPDGQDLNSSQKFAGDDTVGNTFRSGLNASKKRSSRPLVGIGGEELDTLDPVTSIERGFSSSVARYGEQGYLYNAINGWVKAAEEAGIPMRGATPRAKMESVDLTNAKTDVAKALKAERSTISFRLNNTTADVSMLQARWDSMADAVYGKGFVSLAHLMDKARAGDSLSGLRALAFTTKLGLWAVDQVYVQASQLINVMGITGLRAGTGGILAAGPLRMALLDWVPEGLVKHIAATQAPFTSISADDFLKLRDWVKSTGRNVVDQTVIEENNAVTFYNSGFKRFIDSGQTPFKEGEQLARLGAAAANFIERRRKFPAEDIFDPNVTRAMIHRQDVLTASMTSASSARWQKSMLSVPLQFTTFHVRMMEQLFFGGQLGLTKMERARLGATQAIMYGAAGVPAAGYIVDKFAYEHGVTANESNYHAIRYGLLDATLSGLTGADTAVATRLAAGEGVWDLYKSLFGGDKTVPEILGGPSVSIGFDIFTSAKALGESLFSGNFDYVKYDWNRLWRNITVANRIHNSVVAYRTGEYLSRKRGTPILEDLNQVDAVMMGLGIPLKENEAVWTSIEFMKVDDRQLDRDATEVLRKMKVFDDLVAEEDWQGVKNVAEDIQAYLTIMDTGDRSKVLQRVKNRSSVLESVTRRLINRGKLDTARYLKELTDG